MYKAPSGPDPYRSNNWKGGTYDRADTHKMRAIYSLVPIYASITLSFGVKHRDGSSWKWSSGDKPRHPSRPAAAARDIMESLTQNCVGAYIR